MRRTDRRTILQGTSIFLVLGVLTLGCGQSSTEPESAREELVQAAATIAQVAAAVTGQDAPLANDAKAGRNLGFDTNIFPGEKTMRAWKNAPNAPYSWVGYYLPAPCHKDTSWVGTRKLLRTWGGGSPWCMWGSRVGGGSPRRSPRRAWPRLKEAARCAMPIT